MVYGGLSSFEEEKAVEIAKLGYVGFALDIYGKGIRAKSSHEAQILMESLNSNRSVLLSRMKTSLKVCASIEVVDNDNIVAIGYCFGGKCVLYLAKSGEELRGIVSIHGIYDAPDPLKNEKIKTPILILHGWADPFSDPRALLKLTEELTANNANWELIAYGNTAHAFTNGKAHYADKGLLYNENADKKSWNRLLRFFRDDFINTSDL